MDEVFKTDFHFQEHTDTLTAVKTQPTENLILERNKELRKNPGAISDLGGKGDNTWGRHVAAIPLVVYENAKRNGYDLDSKDAKLAAKEMARFLASPIGRACVTNPHNVKYIGGLQ